MIALFVLAELVTYQDERFEVVPESVSGGIGETSFDPLWRLPPVPEGQVDLVARSRQMLGARYEVQLPGGGQARCFGDLIRAGLAIEGSRRGAWLDQLEAESSARSMPYRYAIRQLLQDDFFRGGDWDPEESKSTDGFWEGPGWKPTAAMLEDPPWGEVDVGVRLEQATVFIAADLGSIKAAENDYSAYPDDVGAEYDWIYPVDDAYVRDENDAFAALEIDFKCDLPFPFTGYRCELKILNEIDPLGCLVTHIYSTSDDFHYMVGKDVFLPVDTSDGARLGYLLVRDFGFDLDNIPDGAKHRRAGLRSSLGNLRIKAEKIQQESGREISPVSLDRVPDFRLIGSR